MSICVICQSLQFGCNLTRYCWLITVFILMHCLLHLTLDKFYWQAQLLTCLYWSICEGCNGGIYQPSGGFSSWNIQLLAGLLLILKVFWQLSVFFRMWVWKVKSEDISREKPSILLQAEPSSGQTLVSALKFIRSVYQTSEEQLKTTLRQTPGNVPHCTVLKFWCWYLFQVKLYNVRSPVLFWSILS